MALTSRLSAIVTVGAAGKDRGGAASQRAALSHWIEQGGVLVFVEQSSGVLCRAETKKLARIHPGDNSVTEIPVDEISGVFSGIAVGEGAIWVPNAGRSMLCKIDPRTNQVIMKVSANLPERATGIAAGEGAVWAITGAQAIALKRYSAETGADQASISLPSRGTGVVVAFGSVWITGTGTDELYRVDPSTNDVAATIELRSSPRMLVVGETQYGSSMKATVPFNVSKANPAKMSRQSKPALSDRAP